MDPTRQVDGDRMTWPLRVSYNWARRGLVPDFNEFSYGDAVVILNCFDIFRGDEPDPVDKKETEE